MLQGPPPDNLLDPSPVNQSEQSPPRYHSLPPASQQPQQPQKNPVSPPPTVQSRKSSEAASLEVNQQLAMANPGQPGPIKQGRPTQGNNHFLGRPIRLGNQHMPRFPIIGGTMYPNYLSNAPWALPYPGLNQQPLLFVIGDQFNQKFSNRMATDRRPPYPSFPKYSSPAVNNQPQQPQHQQQTQQQKQQPQQTQQPQQIPVTPPLTVELPESSGTSRMAKSSDLRIVVPVTQKNGEVPSSRDPPNNITMTAFLPINFPANLKSIQPYLEMATDYASVDPCISYWCRLYALEQGFLLKRKEENLPFLLDLMQVLGKNKHELQSKMETTDIPIARAYLQGVIQKLLNWAESAPALLSFTDVVTKAFHTAGILLDVCSIFGESSEDQANKCTDLQEANLHSGYCSATSVTATKKTSRRKSRKKVQHQNVNGLSENQNFQNENLLKPLPVVLESAVQKPSEKPVIAPTITATDERENEAASLKYTCKNDQWSPVNLQGKKSYDRDFILKLQNSPACQKKPPDLAVSEIERDKTHLKQLLKRGDSVSDSVVQYTVPRRIPETTQPPTLSRQVSKDVLLGKSTVTDDEIERKTHSLLSEYFTNENIEDAVLDMKKWLHSSTAARFINQSLLYVLERNKKERRATGTLLKEMVKRKLFHSSDILEGFTQLFESAEVFIVYIPKMWEYVAVLVAPLFEEGVINLNFLPQLSSTLNSSMVTRFVAAVLKELVKEQGVAEVEKMFIMSNVPPTSVLPPSVDPNAFLAQHTELNFLSKVDSILKSETPATSQVIIGFQYSLEKYLRDATHLTKDEVCSWIQEQYVGDVNHVFIRALVTAVIESSIEGRGTESKLNNTVLKQWTVVLRCYVGNIPDRELQLLYAVQTLVAKQQHPKGLIQGIFETLYDSNVVSEEGFESWVSVDDPLEREGKAEALEMVNSFLTRLLKTDPGIRSG